MEAPHEVLGVAPDAPEGEIEEAYRRRVKEAHPDQGGTLQSFLRVRSAYETMLAEGTDPTPAAAVDGVEDGESDGSTAETDEPAEQQDPHVEYLDYEVLADRGWDLEDAFEAASDAGLSAEDFGEFDVEGEESLLEAAEREGFDWPYSCRGGACANCAVAVTEGELSMPVSHVLPDELLDRGIRLSCVGRPVTDEVQVVYNVKHLPDLEELRLPPGPFEWANADD